MGLKLLTWIRLIMICCSLPLGGHTGYQIRLLLAILNLILFEEFQDGHLGYWKGTILAILNLHVTPMLSPGFGSIRLTVQQQM